MSPIVSPPLYLTQSPLSKLFREPCMDLFKQLLYTPRVEPRTFPSRPTVCVGRQNNHFTPTPHPTLIKEAPLSVLDQAYECRDEFTSSRPVQLAPPVHHSEDEVDSGAESYDDTQKKNLAPRKLSTDNASGGSCVGLTYNPGTPYISHNIDYV